MCGDVVAVLCVHSGTSPLLREILEGRGGPVSAVQDLEDVGKACGGSTHIVLALSKVTDEIE